MYYAGQKVIFVGFPRRGFRQIWREFLHPIPGLWPQPRAVYTIVRVWSDDDGAFLSLFELPEESNKWWNYGWDASGFRPVVARKTSIESLEQIRRDVTNKELRPICHDEQV